MILKKCLFSDFFNKYIKLFFNMYLYVSYLKFKKKIRILNEIEAIRFFILWP